MCDAVKRNVAQYLNRHTVNTIRQFVKFLTHTKLKPCKMLQTFKPLFDKLKTRYGKGYNKWYMHENIMLFLTYPHDNQNSYVIESEQLFQAVSKGIKLEMILKKSFSNHVLRITQSLPLSFNFCRTFKTA